jgi:hypothetical protein
MLDRAGMVVYGIKEHHKMLNIDEGIKQRFIMKNFSIYLSKELLLNYPTIT